MIRAVVVSGALVGALVLALPVPGAAVAAASAAPGLLESAASAEAVVLGRPGPTRAVDRHGRSAPFVVERLLSGKVPRPLQVAWEDLAPRKQPRLPEGERVLLALEPLPGASLWRKRFPGGGPLAIGSRGRALRVAPDPASVDALAAWLALDPAARSDARAAKSLVALATSPDAGLAADAVARLDALPGLAAALAEGPGEALAAALAGLSRTDPPRAVALLDLAARRRLEGLLPAALQASQGKGELAAAGWNARAAIEGGLSPEAVAELLRSSDGALRAVGARWLVGEDRTARLHALVSGDPDGQVRRQALRVLGDEVRVEVLVGRLTDRDARVAEDALRQSIDRGPECLVPLLALVDGPGQPGRARAIAALAGFAEGRAELAKVARDHDDPQVRGFARLALGRLETDSHSSD